MNRFHARTDSFTRRPHGKSSAPHSVAGCPWLVAVMALAVNLSPAQEALRNSMAGAAAAEARRLRPESLPFTFKTGELRLLATPSLGVDFNDNINTANTSPQSDFILKPMVQFNVNYPV